MRRFPPPYLTATPQTSPVIRYRWDDWDDGERPLDDNFKQRLVPLTGRAVVAMTIGIAEWIVYRFSELSDDPAPMQYIESSWLQLIDWNYGREWDDLQDYDGWRGPVRAPIWDAMERIQYAVREAEEMGDGSLMCGWNDGLATLVLPDPAPYLGWRDSTMALLEADHLRSSDDPLGEVILPEHFDPPRRLEAGEVERLANDRLHFAKHSKNPFVKSAAEIAKEDFDGEPFVFDLNAERRRRADW